MSRYAVIVSGAILIFLAFFSLFSDVREEPIPIEVERQNRLIKFLVFMFSGVLYSYLGYIYMKRKIPKGFDVFDEEFLKETDELPNK